jgi:hypothetical protein
MIEITIIRNFRNSGLFKTFCQDFKGEVVDNTITFPDHLAFSKIVKLSPTFLPRKIRNFLYLKEIKEC